MTPDGKAHAFHFVTRTIRNLHSRLTGNPRRAATNLAGATRTALVATLLASFGLAGLSAPGANAQEQNPTANGAEQTEQTGRITASFMGGRGPGGARQAKQGARPAWVEDALARSLAHIQQQNKDARKQAGPSDFALRRVDQDDLGQVHLRLDQLQNGVPVYGGQLVTQLDADAVLSVTGRTFDDASAIDTTPTLTGAAAVAAPPPALGAHGGLARTAMGAMCVFAREPEAELVVLPQQLVDGKPGATLCYLVELLVEGGTEATGRHRNFVNALDGRIVWHYNATAHGTGKSLYSGTVTINTRFDRRGREFRLQDRSRTGLLTVDAMDVENFTWGSLMTDDDDTWGDGTTGNRQSAGVDAHYGVARAWDYFLNQHGWHGMDNAGNGMAIYVHYGSNYNNAFWNGNVMAFGDGDGSDFSPLVSLDIVGHEFAHAVTENTADLQYQLESGASNESFSDIFGTAIEPRGFSTPLTSRSDYQIGEDCYTPGTAGDAMRNLADPTLGTTGNIDHYTKIRRPAAGEDPSEDNDWGYVHFNSGIQNKAFFLLAEGGTHPVSGNLVDGIGRTAAERIFFRALSLKLFSTADFADVRAATLSAAADLYGGGGSKEYASTGDAWGAVGIGPGRSPDTSQLKILYYDSQSGSGEVGTLDSNRRPVTLTSYPRGFFTKDWWNIVGGGTDIFYHRWSDGLAAVGNIDAGGNHTTIKSFPVGFFGANWDIIVRHKGSLFFYNSTTGVGSIGRLTGPTGYTQYRSTNFSRGWTHIVSVQGRLLFYNMNTGAAAVGDLEEVFENVEGQFRRLIDIAFKQFSSFHLAKGWTIIVDTNSGILFYQWETGAYAVCDVDSASGITERVPDVSPGGTPSWIKTSAGERFTHIVVIKDVILFYDMDTGSGMTANIYKRTGDVQIELDHEPLVKGESFAMPFGWTHVTTSVDPLFRG
jgi:Zn-dependent metalloprotease